MRRADERIVGGDRILGGLAGRGAAHFLVRRFAARIDIDAQHLAAQEILRRRRVLSQLVDVVSFGFFHRHSASQCVPLSWPPSPSEM